MSRKSRQKKGRTLLQKAMPLWMAAAMLLFGLCLGVVGILGPWISQPTPLEETTPTSAVMQTIEPDYKYRKNRGPDLTNIKITFKDHQPLYIDSVIANETLLNELMTYPSGTVFDMLLKPNGISIMTLSVDGVDILTYEAACRAIKANNAIGVPLGIAMLAIAAYAAWSLSIHWKYRRLT